jgi:N-acetylglucosamine kinase-like BadF-type ATPase
MAGFDTMIYRRRMTSPTEGFLNAQTGTAFFLGVDGGGTKTHAVVIDETKRIIGEGTAGASNPLRVGFPASWQNISSAINEACREAGIETSSITAARVGVAGTRQAETRKRLRESLDGLKIADLRVLTDSAIALFGATGGAPSVVIIAGTGSVCCGVNERGKQACSGGWGPMAGDEGSGVWIARRALQQVAQANDGRSAATALTAAADKYFHTNGADELLAAIYAPHMTNDVIAGFGREVIATARAGDAAAREILASAGRELGLMAASVIRRLNMGREKFQVAHVGSIFAAGEILLDALRAEVMRAAPLASLGPPLYPPATAAALLALKERPQLALAG